MPNPFGGSALLAYFGQYFDHGLDFIDKGLSGRVQIGSDTFPLNAPRSNIATDTGLDPDGIPNSGDEVVAQYVNETAAFADLSQAYGSHNAVTDLLREWVDTPTGPVQTAYLLSGEIDQSGFGLLPTLNHIRANYRIMTGGDELTNDDISNYDGTNQPLLIDFIPVTSTTGELNLDGIGHNFVAGDGRTNENIVLTSIHTIWHRNHNFWVDRLMELTNNTWTIEEYFETARIMNFSEYQRVVFDEFADALIGGLGDSDDHGFQVYDVNIDPSVAIEFAQAAYRLGHSMIDDQIAYVDVNGQLHRASLLEAFLNPANVEAFGVSGLLAGQAAIHHQTIDVNVVDALRNQLLGQPVDLASLNIFRGRDVGIAPFNEIRSQLFEATGDTQLMPYDGWADFQQRNGLSDELMAQLQAAYPDGFETMDLWVGGLAERPIMGAESPSQLGSTFTWIVADQMNRLQNGDRFYYLEILDDDIFQEVENQTSFADIIERNTGLTNLPDLIFQSANLPPPNSPSQGQPLISDASPTEGQLVTASMLGVTDPNGTTGVAFNYQWERFNGSSWLTIAGASGSGFTPTQAEVGQALRVVVAFTDDLGNAEQVTSAATVITGDLFTGTAAGDVFSGNVGDDIAFGLAGNDNLYGGGGVDRTDGGLGNDMHYVDNAGDTVVESAGQGADRVLASVSYVMTAGAEIETLTTTFTNGTSAINLTGNEFANFILGNAGSNILNGGGGDDQLDGWAGNDSLAGGAGDDRINGSSGSDQMAGGLGNDLHYVNSGGDTVAELAGQGADRVLASTSATLTAGAEIETLTTTFTNGTTTINLTGNEFANFILGNAGTNTLNGGGGNDRLDGWSGNDTLLQTSTAGRDFVDGGLGGDTYQLNGVAGAETFSIYSRAAAEAAGMSGLSANTEIVVTRNGANNASIIAELDNIEEISVNALQVTTPGGAGGGANGGDTVQVIGNFNGTSLNFNTITINGGMGDDTVDISGLESPHRIVFRSDGGEDKVIGDLRPQDVLDLASGDSASRMSKPLFADERQEVMHDQLGMNRMLDSGVEYQIV